MGGRFHAAVGRSRGKTQSWPPKRVPRADPNRSIIRRRSPTTKLNYETGLVWGYMHMEAIPKIDGDDDAYHDLLWLLETKFKCLRKCIHDHSHPLRCQREPE
jgi:hypothetical protein